MYIFQCEDSIDGIFSGVYDACSSGYGHKNIRLSVDKSGELQLFCEYIPVETDYEKSKKITDTLYHEFGADFYRTICKCALADNNEQKLAMDKANAIYQTILMAFAYPAREKVLDYVSEPCIHTLFSLCRQTGNEAHLTLEFLRFSELENGILFSTIHPKNYVLPVLADHFSNRLPLENFVIYDDNHKLAVIHKAHSNYMIIEANDLDFDIIKRYSSNEEEYRQLFQTFFDTIAIEARTNPKCQMQHIPKRYWADTVELANKL